MAVFDNWRPLEQYVQAGMEDGKFVNAMFVRLASGPPRLSQIGGINAAAGLFEDEAPNIVYPIGLVQNLGHQANTNFSQIFEVGSNRSYFIWGRTMHQVSFGSIYYHAASLLRRLYAYYQDSVGPVKIQSLFPNVGAQHMINSHDVKVPPGYENLYLNLQSDLFSQPIGLLVYVKDVNEDTIGANYLESVVIPTHSWSTDAQGVVVSEQVSANYERMVPVAVSALPAID